VPFTEERFTDEEHTTYYGRALAVVTTGLQPGTGTGTVFAQGCETKLLNIPIEEAIETQVETQM
jgi:beta-galactosidase